MKHLPSEMEKVLRKLFRHSHPPGSSPWQKARPCFLQQVHCESSLEREIFLLNYGERKGEVLSVWKTGNSPPFPKEKKKGFFFFVLMLKPL